MESVLRLDIWAAVLETYSMIRVPSLANTCGAAEAGFSEPVQLPSFDPTPIA